MSNIRVMIFIEGSNLHWSIKGYNKENKTNLKIDYSKLISLLLKNRTLVRVIYYCSKPIPPGRTSQIKFLGYLRSFRHINHRKTTKNKM